MNGKQIADLFGLNYNSYPKKRTPFKDVCAILTRKITAGSSSKSCAKLAEMSQKAIKFDRLLF